MIDRCMRMDSTHDPSCTTFDLWSWLIWLGSHHVVLRQTHIMKIIQFNLTIPLGTVYLCDVVNIFLVHACRQPKCFARAWNYLRNAMSIQFVLVFIFKQFFEKINYQFVLLHVSLDVMFTNMHEPGMNTIWPTGIDLHTYGLHNVL